MLDLTINFSGETTGLQFKSASTAMPPLTFPPIKVQAELY